MNNFSSIFKFNFGDSNDLVYNLLLEEDFDFGNREIIFEIQKENQNLNVIVNSDSFLNLKVGVSALIKSIEIIEKTINV